MSINSSSYTSRYWFNYSASNPLLLLNKRRVFLALLFLSLILTILLQSHSHQARNTSNIAQLFKNSLPNSLIVLNPGHHQKNDGIHNSAALSLIDKPMRISCADSHTPGACTFHGPRKEGRNETHGGLGSAIYINNNSNPTPTILSLITITNGSGKGNGGGIFIAYSRIILNVCRFIHNFAYGYGSAIFLWDESLKSRLTLNGVFFSENWPGNGNYHLGEIFNYHENEIVVRTCPSGFEKIHSSAITCDNWGVLKGGCLSYECVENNGGSSAPAGGMRVRTFKGKCATDSNSHPTLADLNSWFEKRVEIHGEHMNVLSIRDRRSFSDFSSFLAKGVFTPPSTNKFFFRAISDGGAWVFIDGVLVSSDSQAVELVGLGSYDVAVFFNWGEDINFFWKVGGSSNQFDQYLGEHFASSQK